MDEVFPKIKTYSGIYTSTHTFSSYNMTFDPGFRNTIDQLSQKPSNQTDNKIVKQKSSYISLTSNSYMSYTFLLLGLRALNGVLNDRNI